MHWVLILHLAGTNGVTVDAEIGLIATEEACRIAGVGMSVVIESRVQNVDVTFSCQPEIAA